MIGLSGFWGIRVLLDEAEEVDVFGESRGALWVWEIDELSTGWASKGVGVGFWEVFEAGLACRVAAGEYTGSCGVAVVGLEADRALRQVQLRCRLGHGLLFKCLLTDHLVYVTGSS